MFDWDVYKTLRKNYILNHTTENLNAIREFLDSCNMKMPKQKYVYEEENIHSWKYLDGVIEKKVHYTNVLNPKFRYGYIK